MKPDASAPTPADLSAARAAADGFLHAVMTGDEAAARVLLMTRDGESLDFKTMHESTAGYELGPAKADGAQVVIIAIVRAAPGKEAPPALPLVLARENEAWKVDMGASITKMLGVNLEDLVKQMAQGLGDVMVTGMQAVAEGLSSLSKGDGQAPAEAPRPKAKEKPKAAKKRGKK